MKHLIKIILFCALAIPLSAQQNNTYHWYKHNKFSLEIIEGKRFVLLDNSVSLSSTENKLLSANWRVVKSGLDNAKQTLNTVGNHSASEDSLVWIIAEAIDGKPFPNIGNDIYSTPFYKQPHSNSEFGLSHLFYVKLKSVADFSELERMAQQHGVKIIGNNRFMPLWFTLSCSRNSSVNALEMANRFYESELFQYAEADFMIDDLTHCVNDPLFGDQWALNNTGQNNGIQGIDIGFCNARQISTGDANVVVAVLDHGIELNHPDLTNMFPLSFDTETGTMPSQVLGNHGTACAGIIGAAANNNLGVAGIAPNCPIMSISNSLASTPNSRQRRADGINWAWNNGASVISNSWGSAVQYQIIDDAINDALTLGRGGLGCVVVFSTGNDDGNVSYPANSNPNIIAVGAMSPCGERKNSNSCDGENWGGNFGNELDVVAPGVLIPTTDRQGANGYNTQNGVAGDYTMAFNGTSAACPHVAGIAGLLLSRYPCLTQPEVNAIIERSAIKVRPDLYDYNTVGGRPNGTWHNQMGYGLANANSALLSLLDEFLLQDETETGARLVAAIGEIRAGRNVTPTKNIGNYVVANGADVEFKATDAISGRRICSRAWQ